MSLHASAHLTEPLAAPAVQPIAQERVHTPPRPDPPIPAGRAPSVLVVDDDVGTCETFEFALKHTGFEVQTARSGADGLRIARTGRFDLLLIDLALPDMRGTDMVRALQGSKTPFRFILASAFLTTEITVQAMRMGAVDVVEKPISIDDLPALVRSAVRRCQETAPSILIDGSNHAHASSPSAYRPMGNPGSAAERWAMYVMRGCHSSTDLKTLEQWAACVGVSYTSLRESCLLVGMRPLDARDFVRVLRAVLVGSVRGCPPEVLLDVCDQRTLESLLRRSGLRSLRDVDCSAIDAFFRYQQFLPADNAAVRLVWAMLTGRGSEE